MKINLNTPEFSLLLGSFFIIIILVPMSMQTTCGQDTSIIRISLTKTQLHSFKGVCESYFTITGKAPSKLEDFVRPSANNHPWKQLLEEIPKDPWGNEYLYSLIGNSATVSSTGPTDSISDDIKVSFNFSEIHK